MVPKTCTKSLAAGPGSNLRPAELASEASGHVAVGVQRALFVTAAVVCLILAAIGVILPGLPTTPFVLLASALLIRSSPRLHARLARSRLFGSILREWNEQRAISRRTKWWALAVVSCCLAVTLTRPELNDWLRGMIAVCAGVGLTVILRLPVSRPPQ